MEKIGTVTKYYRFVDSSIQEILEMLLNDAQNYYDFLNKLSNVVIKSNSPEPLAHISVILSSNAEEIDINSRIAEKYGDILTVKPWIMRYKKSNKLEAVNNLIASNPPDWILIQAYLRKVQILYLVPEAYDCLQAAKKILDTNPILDCFRGEFCSHEMILQQLETHSDRVGQARDEGLRKAREYNDLQLEIELLIQQASFLMDTDIQGAFDGTRTAYTLAKKLGLPSLLTSVVSEFGMLSTIMGEYDLALRAYADSVDTLQSRGFPLCHIPIRISQLYADLDDAHSALEWANVTLEIEENLEGQGGLDDHLCPHVTMARALVISGRLQEALEYVTKSHEIALKSGQEALLAMYYFVQGIYDIASGELHSGIDVLSRAVEICDRLARSQRLKNRCLLALSKAEVELFQPHDREELDPDDAGPWMTRLGQESRKKGLHGVQMQHALIKAEFQEKLGLIHVALETLENALGSTDISGAETIREQIRVKIQELKERPIST